MTQLSSMLGFARLSRMVLSIKMDQILYIESIKPVTVSKQQSMMRHEPLNKNELKQFRSVIGQLGWEAGQTRPDIVFDCCELSNSVKHATTEDLLRANKVLSRAKSEPIVLTFKNMGDLSTAEFVSMTSLSATFVMVDVKAVM